MFIRQTPKEIACDAMNYNTEREHVLASALGPLDCPSCSAEYEHDITENTEMYLILQRKEFLSDF